MLVPQKDAEMASFWAELMAPSSDSTVPQLAAEMVSLKDSNMAQQLADKTECILDCSSESLMVSFSVDQWDDAKVLRWVEESVQWKGTRWAYWMDIKKAVGKAIERATEVVGVKDLSWVAL